MAEAHELYLGVDSSGFANCSDAVPEVILGPRQMNLTATVWPVTGDNQCAHLVIVYPLWLGTMPAILKAFLEQVARPGFAFAIDKRGRMTKGLKGKSARVVITMGMPVFVYRWYFGAHSLKSLERNILGLAGIRPVRESLYGMVEGVSEARRKSWLEAMRRAGRAAN